MDIDLKRERDVVVVGAGPAGSAAAYFMANQGHDVLLVESKRLPRTKPCGDGIGPRAVLALENLGLGDWLKTGNWHRVDRLRIVAPSGASIASSAEPEIFPIVYGYVIKRDVFDNKLVEFAKSAGADFIEGFKADELVYQGGRVGGVSGTFQDHRHNLRAKLAVVADGSKGAISRLFGDQVSDFQAVGLRAYADNVAGIDDCANIYFNKQFPNGYGWIFPTSPSSANVGVGLLGINKNRSGRAIHSAFSYFTDQQNLAPLSLQNSRIEGRPVGSVMRMNFGKRPLWRPGLAFAGDAAGLVSPINGEGISHAIESAQLLSEQLGGQFKSVTALDRALAGYAKALEQRFLAYFKWGRLLDKVLGKPGRLDKLIAKAQRDRYLRIVLTGVLANTIHPRELARLKVLTRILF